MQSARKDGPQLIDDFVNTTYEYYKVLLMTHSIDATPACLDSHSNSTVG